MKRLTFMIIAFMSIAIQGSAQGIILAFITTTVAY